MTFEVAQERCLLSPFNLSSEEPERMRIAKQNGQHLLVVEVRNIGSGLKTIRQFASRDNGSTFEQIGADVTGEKPDAIAVGGFFIVSYSTSNAVKTRRVGSAFSKLSESTENRRDWRW